MWDITLVLSAVLAAACVEGAQYFIQSPSDVQTIQGGTAVIKCEIGDRKGVVQWTKGGFSLGFNRTIPGYPRYTMGSQRSEDFSLMIEDVNLEDDDDYSCQVSPRDGDARLNGRATLTVLVPCEPPTILGSSTGGTVTVEYTQQSVELVCEARAGKPAATLKWYLNDDIELVDNIRTLTLDIPGSKLKTSRSILTIPLADYREKDGNTYRCTARNEATFSGALRTYVKLSVLYPPGPPVISGYNGRPVKVNDTLNFLCTSTGGNPAGVVYWSRNNVVVDSSYKTSPNYDGEKHSTNNISILVTEDDNNARYSCDVSSQNLTIPRTQKEDYVLSVLFPPKRVEMTGAREPIREGTTIILQCLSSSSNPSSNITWFAGDRALGRHEYTESYEAGEWGGHRTKSRLTKTVSPQDNNVVYTCHAKNRHFPHSVAARQTLNVLYPPNAPTISGYTEGTTIRAGRRTQITCIAVGGNPVADLIWYKGAEKITISRKGNMGNIAQSEISVMAAANDNGAVYKCQANNTATATPLEARVRLTVNFPPSAVYISVTPSQARVGQSVTLTCYCSSSNPAAEITWTRNGRRMIGTNLGMSDSAHGGKNTTNRLTFPAASRDHNAVFGCRATNMALDESVNDAVTLNVLFKPEFDLATLPTTVEMKKGERGSINLTTRANPPDVTYILYKDRARVRTLPPHFSLTGGILNISHVERSDTGTYMIKASNTEGSSMFNFSLIVKYPAVISHVSGPQTVDEGDNITLRCVADAYPIIPSMFMWYRQGFDMSRATAIQQGNESTLTIRVLHREDSGEFQCTVDNRVGAPDQKMIPLTVRFSPVIDKSPELSRSAGQTGTDVTLRCKVAGAPSVDITWTRNNTRVTTDNKFRVSTTEVSSANYESLLHVKSVSQADYGAYVCTARNEKGSDVHSVTLAGTSKPFPPYNIKVVNVTARSVTISWKAGFNGGLSQSFRVRYKPVEARGFVYVDVRPFGALSYKITGLQKDTRYEFTVLAFNDLGESAYQDRGIMAKTMEKEVPADVATSELQGSDETPVIIILVVCIVGVFILTLNVGLILFFIRKRKKRLEGASDTASHTNTFELYGSTNKGDHLYPPPPSDDTRSYGTYDKSMDDFSDDYIRDYDRKVHFANVLEELESFNALKPPYKNYQSSPIDLDSQADEAEDLEVKELLTFSSAYTHDRVRRAAGSRLHLANRECETHVFLPPPQCDYPTSRPYSPSHKLAPCESPRLLGGGTKMTTYIGDERNGRTSPWTEDLYKRAQPPPKKGSYENGVPNGDVYEFKNSRGKGMNELSEYRPANRPPSRSGSSSVLSPNIVANPNSYSGAPVSSFTNGGPQHTSSTNNVSHHQHNNTRAASPLYNQQTYKRRQSPSPHNTVPVGSEFRGHLV